MDQIDINLFEAWHRIGDQLRQDRLAAAFRSRRRFNSILLRPPRAHCLCLRACDTRITEWNAIIGLDPEVTLGLDETVEHALKRGQPHSITLTGDVIRSLTKPVSIDGDDWMIAAQRLGMHCEMLRSWMKRGVFIIKHYNSTSCKKRGRPVPHLWSLSPLDPNSPKGIAPDPIWGTNWQQHWQQMPVDYSLNVQRVAVQREYNKKNWDEGHCYDIRHRGWRFICPGKYIAPDVIQPCGRKVARLYFPLPIWTLAQAINDHRGFDVSSQLPLPLGGEGRGEGEDSSSRTVVPAHAGTQKATHETLDSRVRGKDAHLRLAGQWFPGSQPNTYNGLRSFACHHCWKVRFNSFTDCNGWNEFVMYHSGGLLYGHEVKRPLEDATYRRRKKYRPQIKRRPAPRRQQALEGLMRGETYKQVAARMGVTYGTVHMQVKTLFAKHDVHSIQQLAEKLGYPIPQQNSGRRLHTAPRRKQVARLRRAGLSRQLIAERLGVTIHVVDHDVKLLKREQRNRAKLHNGKLEQIMAASA